MIKRREFIALLGNTALAWPAVPRAQQPVPVLGFLSARSRNSDANLVAAFRQGLAEAGYVEGKSVAIEFRWGDGYTDHLPAMARDLAERRVALIFAAGGISALVATRTTSTVPIVFVSTSDPLEYGVVTQLNRPGGNVTGVIMTAVALAPKRVELLIELLPQAKRIAVLVNPGTVTTTPTELRDLPTSARLSGRTIRVVEVASERDFEPAFALIVRERCEALLVGTDPLFVTARAKIVALAARYRLPAIYDRREFAELGGLMSYGTNIAAGYRRGGVYAGQVLAGAKPGDLPVEQAATFELVINSKTAKSLNLTVPDSILVRADNVIE